MAGDPRRVQHRTPHFVVALALSLVPLQAGADTGYSNVFPVDRGMTPSASFTYAPSAPTVGTPVQFTVSAMAGLTSWSWDLNGDGRADVVGGSPTHVFTSAGSHVVTLETANASGTTRVSRTVTVFPAGSSASPRVTQTKWAYPGYFLEGTDLRNRLDVTVDWAGGTPGTVRFSVNGGAANTEPGTASGASHVFDLKADFPSRLDASVITVTPVSAAGAAGAAMTALSTAGTPGSPAKEQFLLFPRPKWLDMAFSVSAGAIKPEIGLEGDEVNWILALELPNPKIADDCELDCAILGCDGKCKPRIPDWVPYINGTFSLLETFGGLKGTLSSSGRGTFSVFGTTGFFALGGGKSGGGLQGTLTGSGEFLALPSRGLELTGASVRLDLEGTLATTRKLSDLGGPIGDRLSEMEDWKVVGGAIRWFNEKAHLIGEVTADLRLTSRWAQMPSGGLEFAEGQGSLKLEGKGTVEVKLTKNMKARAWLALGMGLAIGLPEPVFRAGDGHFEVGAKFETDGLWEIEAEVKGGGQCTYAAEPPTAEPRWDCRWGAPQPLAAPRALTNTSSSLRELRHDYSAHGAYSRFEAKSRLRAASSAVPVSVTESSLVTNVFPGASPALSPAGGNTRLLLWAQQDPGLPVSQSTDIAWSYFDGTSWTAPAIVQHDTQAEIGPVAALDASGKVVAAWLRNKDAAFSAPMLDTADLSLFYNRLEVVAATFDPATQTWSVVTPLTDDDALDGSLSLAGDTAGNVLLTWLTNAGGEFQSTTASPSSLKAAVWNGTSFDSAVVLASDLVGVSNQSSARFGSSAAVVLSRDPDPATPGDDVVDLYPWNGSGWGPAEAFAAGSGGNRQPLAAYTPDGTLHVVWLRGGDLVEGAPGATPSLLRADSDSIGFLGSLLVAGPSGTLTLLYQEVVDNGPANVFARIFDPASGTWSEDRRLTQDPTLAHDLGAYHGSDGQVHVAYLATEITRTTKDVVIEGQPVTLTNIPVDGRTDLRVLEHQLVVDLAVAATDLKVTPPYPNAGDTVDVAVDVHNAGDFATGAFAVALYVTGEEGCPASCPTPQRVAEATVAAPFSAGESRKLSFTFVQPADAFTLTALVDTLGDVTELTEANNQVEWAFGNRPPVARIVASATAGTPPVSITFDAGGSLDPDGDPMQFSWTFADGTAGAEGVVVSHEFTTSGRFPVTLVVKDSKGSTSTAVVYVSVLASCENVTPPVVSGPSLSPAGADYVVSWSDTSPAGTYEIEESADAWFSNPARSVVIGARTSYRHAVTVDRSYYYRVRAVDLCSGTTHASPWSAPAAVGVIAPPIEGYFPLTPCRVVNTRKPEFGTLGSPPIEAAGSEDRLLVLAGSCGIPGWAKAVALNLTVAETAGAGYLTLYPGDGAAPATSTINFAEGQVKANNAIVPLATDGTGSIRVKSGSVGSLNLLIDVTGYFQ